MCLKPARAVDTTFSAFLGGSLVESFTAASDSGFPADSGRFYGFEGIVFDEIRLSINAVNMGANLDNLQYNVANVPEPATRYAQNHP